MFVSMLAASTADAAPCAGFNDVSDASPFCTDVAWIKNRGVTNGCAASLYCPTDPVTRLAMAAFLHRLGIALTPEPLTRAQTVLALTLLPLLGDYVCVSPPSSQTNYSRFAMITATLDYLAPGSTMLSVDPVFSLDGGSSWNNANATSQTIYSNVAGFGNGTAISGAIGVPAGTFITTGLFIRGSNSAVTNVVVLNCLVRTTVHSNLGL
jgi:hypothetical protein